ncbi:MAG: HAD-IIA family hydrolase [Anaerolineales bacterium]
MNQKWVEDLKGIILDMDGVLWKGSQPLADLPSVFDRVSNRGWKVLGMTNNSTRTPAHYLAKLKSFGVDLEPWQVINSSEATAEHLKEMHPQGGYVYAVGERGLLNALSDAGFSSLAEEDREPLAVVAGMDRELTYRKIERAARYIRKGIPFIGTNPDKTYPTPNGLAPGAGVVLAAIEAASGISPQIMGKPNRRMYQAALKRLNCSPEEVLVVGDRLETDILGAHHIGCRSGLVLSGVSSWEDLEGWSPKPDLVADDVESLLETIQSDE